MMNTQRKATFISSLRNALQGCRKLFGTERNARIHLSAFVVVVFAGFYFSIDRMEWVAILIASGAVIAMEATNTAIEKTIDLLHPQYHEKAGQIKDVAAGAVLIVTCAAIGCGVIIFLPKVLQLFS